MANTRYIRAGRLITGRAHEVIKDAAVLVQDGWIVAAGRADEVPAPRDDSAPVLDVPAGTILPGLIDAHVHLTFRRGETTVSHATQVSDETALLRGVQAARWVAAAGVTTVRDCAARGRVVQILRDAIRDGLVVGPRVLASGPPVTTTAGHLWALGYEADTAAEARRAVRRLAKEGADFIKVCATGGGMTPGSVTWRAQYTEAQLAAIVEDAHRLGRHVAAHVHGTEGIARATAAGVDTLEHCSWQAASGHGHDFDEDVAREMARRGTYANIASGPPRALAFRDAPPATGDDSRPLAPGPDTTPKRWEHARRMIDLGVQVCFSTDSIYGWYDNGRDLTYLAQMLVDPGGFAPLDVIQMITAVPARAIGWGDRIGTVEEGRLADLLVVDGDPSTDIRALHHVRAVYKEGVPIR